MASFIKWLGAGLGWSFGGPIGAFLGFLIGKALDGFTQKDFDFLKENAQKNGQTTSGDFQISLLILSSIVIKADGKIAPKELHFVQQHFVKMYGKESANQAFRIFKAMMKENVSTKKICQQIRQQTTHATRLQLLHYLFALAKSDGIVSDSELKILQTIAHYLYIHFQDFESMKAMFYENLENAYQILEIPKTASEQEIKNAYRKLVKKHHPDKLRHLGEAHLKGAKEKFVKIQEAYEYIKKKRSF